jgi:hypothetical protein
MALSDRFKKVTERAQRLAEQAAVELQEAAETAKTRTSELAHENRDKIGSVIDKTASTVAEHTGDRYRDRIDGVRSQGARRAGPGGRLRRTYRDHPGPGAGSPIGSAGPSRPVPHAPDSGPRPARPRPDPQPRAAATAGAAARDLCDLTDV